MALDVRLTGQVRRETPGSYTDGADSAVMRLGRYGEILTHPLPLLHQLADEGSLFVATNPTPGTAIATGASVQQSFSATVPHFVIKNNAPVGAGTRAYLHFMKLIHIGGTAPASATSFQMAVVLDAGNRVPTAGSQTITPVNTNADASQSSVCAVYAPSASNLTAPAAVSARTVARLQLKGAIPVILDDYTVVFGGDQAPFSMPFSAVGRHVEQAPAVVIPPQGCALIHLWWPAGVTNAFTHEFAIGLSER